MIPKYNQEYLNDLNVSKRRVNERMKMSLTPDEQINPVKNEASSEVATIVKDLRDYNNNLNIIQNIYKVGKSILGTKDELSGGGLKTYSLEEISKLTSFEDLDEYNVASLRKYCTENMGMTKTAAKKINKANIIENIIEHNKTLPANDEEEVEEADVAEENIPEPEDNTPEQDEMPDLEEVDENVIDESIRSNLLNTVNELIDEINEVSGKKFADEVAKVISVNESIDKNVPKTLTNGAENVATEIVSNAVQNVEKSVKNVKKTHSVLDMNQYSMTRFIEYLMNSGRKLADVFEVISELKTGKVNFSDLQKLSKQIEEAINLTNSFKTDFENQTSKITDSRKNSAPQSFHIKKSKELVDNMANVLNNIKDQYNRLNGVIGSTMSGGSMNHYNVVKLNFPSRFT